MIRIPPQISRPGLLAGLATLSLSAGIAACVSMMTLATALDAPLGIRLGADRLEATLASDDYREPGQGGPAVWVATAPDCHLCESSVVQTIEALHRDGFEVRVLVLKPGGNGPRHRALRAVAAENGLSMQLPAVFWRSGGQWRAAFGPATDLRDRVRADAAPNT